MKIEGNVASRKPLVSVCIPAYNRGKMLRACLWSVVRQSLSDLEIIVVDNDSEEDLKKVVLGFNDPRIHYYRNKINVGAANNFDRAAKLARGEYLKFVCSDDLLLPTCLEESVKALEAYPEASAVLFRYASFNSDYGYVDNGTYPLPWLGLAKNLCLPEFSEVYSFTNVSPTAMLFRRTVFESFGGYNRNLEAMGDWELYARLLRKGGGIVFSDHVLAIYLVHADSESQSQGANGGFFRDLMKVRRDGFGGSALDNGEVIWRELSRTLRAGKNVLPVLHLVYSYGYLGHFVALLPLLAFKHLRDRFRRQKQWNDKVSDLSVPVSDKRELMRVLNETWNMSRHLSDVE